MKIIESNYKKMDGSIRPIKVLVTNNTPEKFSGVDMSYLNDEETAELLKIQEKYEEDMSVFYKKAFRNFNHSGLIAEETKKEEEV